MRRVDEKAGARRCEAGSWAKPKQAGKKEGGFGGNSAFPLRNQIEASPATCPNTWRAEHRRKILFSLEEKEIGRAQIKRTKDPEGNIIINLNQMNIQNPAIKANATSSLSTYVTGSTPDQPVTLKFKVWPFPGRDADPCDSYGIYMPAN